MPADRSTRIMHNYSERVKRTRQAIEENPGITSRLLCSLLSLEMKVRPDRILEYVRTLGDAKLIVAESGKLWTRQAYDNYQEAKRKQGMTEEDQRMQDAKERRMAPLEAYDTETNHQQ